MSWRGRIAWVLICASFLVPEDSWVCRKLLGWAFMVGA